MPSEHLRKPTLSRSLSFSLSSDLLRPSSSRSIRRIVSPERVLNFFLQEKEKMIRICCKHRKLKRYNFPLGKMSFCMKQQDNSFSCVIRLSSLTLPPEVIDHTKTGGGKGGWGIIVRRGEARRGEARTITIAISCFVLGKKRTAIP